MKFSPQIHLFLCLAMLVNMAVPAVVRADPPHAYAAERSRAPAANNDSICAKINSSNGQPLAGDERQKRKEKLFSDLKRDMESKNSLHRHHLKINAPSMQVSVNAQNEFFEYLKVYIEGSCKRQAMMQERFQAYQTKAAAISALEGDEKICGGYQEAEKLYAESIANVKQTNDIQQKAIPELRDSYNRNAANNREEIEKDPLQSQLAQLRMEAIALWGNNTFISSRFSTAEAKEAHKRGLIEPDKNGLFSRYLLQLEADARGGVDYVKGMEVERTKMASAYAQCASFVPGAAPVVANNTSDESDITGNQEEDPNATNDTNPNADPTQQTTPDPSETDQTNYGADENGKILPYVPDKKIGDENVNASAPPPTRQPEKEEGWISRNKGLLLTVGAGAAAVGGILWYKKSQDKKAEEDASILEMEARALASSSSGSSTDSSSSSTSTSTNTDSTFGGTPANVATPQGSKLALSGIPSSATVSSTLSEITVAILNPTGILTQDSQTEVTVSCAEPIGCSLTGTLTVQASAGKAKFNDLRFSSSHEGAKLTFSSPGFEPVTSESFGVTGGGGTRE